MKYELVMYQTDHLCDFKIKSVKHAEFSIRLSDYVKDGRFVKGYMDELMELALQFDCEDEITLVVDFLKGIVNDWYSMSYSERRWFKNECFYYIPTDKYKRFIRSYGRNQKAA